jgi:hypothetical protein
MSKQHSLKEHSPKKHFAERHEVKKRHQKFRPVKRMSYLLFLVLILLGCGQETQTPQVGSDTGGPLEENVETLNGQAVPTLLASYALQRNTGLFEYTGVTYRPRAYTTAPYQGWDTLELPGGNYRTYVNRDWVFLELRRPARLAVIWNGSQVGSWLSSWKAGATVGGKKSYTKDFPAGKVVLGAIGGTANQPYTVLIAEANGVPSKAPVVPAGLEVPQINKACPAWVHNRYTTRADDGRVYRTWHPVIDPVYWCYFGHEHGADPSLMPSKYKAAYEYTAYYNDRQSEAHNFFRGFYFQRGGYHWYMNVHFDSVYSRVCGQFHTIEIRAEEPSGALVLHLRFKGDFGETRANGYPDPANPSKRAPVTTKNCTPSNLDLAKLPTNAEKNLRAKDNTGYETWRIDDVYSGKILGLNLAGLTFDTLNPTTKCVGLTCDTVEATGDNGTKRAIDFLDGLGISWNTIPGNVRAAITKGNGYFYTDQYGNQLRTSQDPTLKDAQGKNAIRQYIRPNLNISLAGVPQRQFCYTLEPWRGNGQCGDEKYVTSFTLESAIWDN